MAKSKITLKFKKLRGIAVLPQKAHPKDVGLDVKVVSVEYDFINDSYIYHSGLAMETNEAKIVASLVFPKSRNIKTDCYLANSIGIIDSDTYRGEIMAVFKNRTSMETRIEIETLKRLVSKKWYEKKDYDATRLEVKQELQRNPLKFAPYKIGDFAFQLVPVKVDDVEIVEVDELSTTDRGIGGFGSTK